MIAVTSPESGDGKTVTSLNIAGALAMKSDVNVLLVDGDLCRASVARLAGIPASPGLIDVLAGTCALENAIVRIEQFPNLYLLPAGEGGKRRTELLDSPRWKAVCALFQKQFRFTIMDTSPIAAVADYDLIQEVCDGVIIVVRPDFTNRTLCFQALKTVPEKKLIGVVMNAADHWFLSRSSSYYHYGYYYQGGNGKSK